MNIDEIKENLNDKNAPFGVEFIAPPGWRRGT